MRVQLALNVKDLDAAVDHYRAMFGVDPHKRRPGYANFAIANPPLKLVLFENPAAAEPLNHLGVEAESAAEFEAQSQRLRSVGLAGAAADTVCCHARQDKLWVRRDDETDWEWYRVTDENVEADDDGACCSSRTEEGEVCCA